MPNLRTINVVANPYIAIDADGIPQGVVAMPGTRNLHIGARVDHALSTKTGKSRFYFPLDRDQKPIVKAQLTPEIARSVREGELIAADEKSARMCGINKHSDPEKGFMPWEDALEREKQRALAYHRSVNGEDAELQEIPRDEDAKAAAWLATTQGQEGAQEEVGPAGKTKSPVPSPGKPSGAPAATRGDNVSPNLTLEHPTKES